MTFHDVGEAEELNSSLDGSGTSSRVLLNHDELHHLDKRYNWISDVEYEVRFGKDRAFWNNLSLPDRESENSRAHRCKSHKGSQKESVLAALRLRSVK